MRHRPLLLVAWLGAVAAAVLVGTNVASGSPARLDSCGLLGTSSAESLPLRPESAKSIVLLNSAAFSLRFDDSRDPIALPIVLDTFPPLSPGVHSLKVEFGSGHLRSGEGRTIAPKGDGLLVTGGVTELGNVKVCLALNPQSVGNLRPGRYTGSVIVGGDVQKVSLPVEVTFRDARRSGIAIAFLGVLLGLAVKILSEAAAGHRALGVGAKKALRAYVTQLSFPITVILAAVAGWLGFVQMYEVDPDWGAGGTDATKLFAACFIVQMSSIEGVDLVRRAAGREDVQPAAVGGA